MMRPSIMTLMVVVVCCLLGIPPSSAQGPDEAEPLITEETVIHPTENADIPQYYVVRTFYTQASHRLRADVPVAAGYLRRLGMDPGSEAAKLFSEAVWAADAIKDDVSVDDRLEGEEFRLAQVEAITTQARLLAEVHGGLLQDLTEIGFDSESVTEFIENDVRSGMRLVTLHGPPDPDVRKGAAQFDVRFAEVLAQ